METLLPYKKTQVDKRNYTLDALKAFFAIMIITVHFPFSEELGHICSNIGICGVILFFLISGYSSYDEDDDVASSNILKRFKRNGTMFLIVVGIYAVLATGVRIISGELNEFTAELSDPWRFPRLFLLGDLSFILGDPLWFMVALLYSYLILYLLHRLKIMKYAYYTIPLFLAFRIVVECYVNTYPVDWHYSSFFLASGFPIMLLGNFIACKKEAFLKAPLYVTIILTIVSTAMMFVTIHIRAFGYDVAQIFKIWCMVEIFILALKLPGKKEIPILSKFGRKYSAYIYYFHNIVGRILLLLLYLLPSQWWVYDWVIPISAIIAGVLIPVLMYELNQKIKSMLKSRRV